MSNAVLKVNYVLPELTCKICDHVWFARKNGKILNCPRCRSTDWNEGVNKSVIIPMIMCPKCEHVWAPRNMKIQECPVCKRHLINTGIKK